MTYTADNYANVAELIDSGDIEPAQPTVGIRTDGVGLVYRAQFNTFFGNPESGKTLLALCILVDELNRGGSGIIIDLDHNGASGTISRLIAMGADELTLRDPEHFRYCAPEDADQLAAIVEDTRTWEPVMVLLDSIGELLPLYGASSNSPDDFTRVHSLVIKPLINSGAAVVGIDHLAKNVESQAYGSTGTAAKKRVVGGTSLRVTVIDPFKPGFGGKAQLTINKDRHGGLRAASPAEEREPLAATFQLSNSNGDIRWEIIAPAAGERTATPDVSSADIRDMLALDPPPLSQRDVKDRLGWGSTRALRALREYRRLEANGEINSAPRSPAPMSGAQEHHTAPAPRSAPGAPGAQEINVSRIATGAAENTLLPAPHTGEQEHRSTCAHCQTPLHPALIAAGDIMHPECEETVWLELNGSNA